ncbi:MAG: hypothetical protein DRG78_20155 [Epsilonproteobacteria bacterium]|nr:MAG: hypothetical protein DRG78_20155 [Campylobacterota bacterium]
MSVIKSTTKEELQSKFEYEIVFEEVEGISKTINDENILDEATATLRADAEFLEYGMDKQTVTFTTFYTHIGVGDIIKISAPSYRVPKELNKDRFIVESVKSVFKGAKAINEIKGVRYD